MKPKYKTEIISNPEELQIISNPKTQTISKMAKSKATKFGQEFLDRMKPYGLILTGQAGAATGNALITRHLLNNQNAIVQQVAKAGFPILAGLVLASTKNENLKGIGLGAGTIGLMEAFRFIWPGFDPQQGFADSSGYVYPSHTIPRTIPENRQLPPSLQQQVGTPFFETSAEDEESVDFFS